MYSHLKNSGKKRSRRQVECFLRHVVEKVSSAMLSAYIVEEIIKSIIKTNNVDTGHAFRNYYYAIVIAKLIEKCVLKNICLDIECSVSLINRA